MQCSQVPGAPSGGGGAGRYVQCGITGVRSHAGMDTSKKTIMIATLWPGRAGPGDRADRERGGGDLGGSLALAVDSSVLRSCYEAGPGGYDLYWLLESMGVACDVVAPSLIPKGGSDKVRRTR